MEVSCQAHQSHYDLFLKLPMEAGGHRVQRVPPTERQGRVHTSTVTCAVLDPHDASEHDLDPREFEVQWYSGTGSGGQHRNKHQNSCRLIHRPTGMVSTAQCRSRQQSYDQALEDLRQRLSRQHGQHQRHQENTIRHSQVGSGMRGDKIRTYRFQDDTVKDHRTDKTLRLRKVLAGDFDFYSS